MSRGVLLSTRFAIPTLEPLTSNPVACVDGATAAVMVFSQGSDGQVRVENAVELVPA